MSHEIYKSSINKIVIHHENGQILQLTDKAASQWQKIQNKLLHSYAIEHHDENISQEWEIIRDKI